MNDLMQRSIEIILENQHPSGAYIASPNFPNYRYCWFRDGAFTAYAMDLVGEQQSAARFHAWVANIVNHRRDLIANAINKSTQRKPLEAGEILDTRYAVDGKAAEEDWPNFQLDGFGTWLWALKEHQGLTQSQLPANWLEAAHLVADYLAALWRLPCFDSWEEFPDVQHTYTLSAIYSGLQAYSSLSSTDRDPILKEISARILTAGVSNGHFTKSLGSNGLDANLLGLTLPYAVVAPDDRRMRATVSAIEAELRPPEGGLRRYASDSYYGGGDWILLTAWLGWYYAKIGERAKAEEALYWVEAQADADGQLPEQVPSSLVSLDYYHEWTDRWGPIAKPLLWSHAMYIILKRNL